MGSERLRQRQIEVQEKKEHVNIRRVYGSTCDWFRFCTILTVETHRHVRFFVIVGLHLLIKFCQVTFIDIISYMTYFSTLSQIQLCSSQLNKQ